MKNSILLTSGPTTNRVTAHSVVRRWDEGRAKSLPSFSGLHHFFVLRFAFSIIHGRGRAQTTTTTKKWLYYTECKPKRKKKNEWGLETRSQELNFKALGLLFHFPVMCLTVSNVLLVSMFLLLSPLQSCTLDTTLVGHSAPVTSAIFSPHHAHTTVVTVSEDRTFKVRTLLIFVLPVSFILWVGKNTIASLSIGTGTGGLWLVGWGWSTLGTTLQLLGGIWAWVAGVKLVLFPGHIFASQTSPTFFNSLVTVGNHLSEHVTK